MSGSDYIAAVDQGTSSTKAVGLSLDGRVLGDATVAVARSHPRPGWVEQDPDEIADSVVTCLTTLSRQLGRPPLAVGLSTQRESALIWDTRTGEALGPLLSWQDRRTTARSQELHAQGCTRQVRDTTGLPLDPMFSALKLEWLLDRVDPARRASRAGRIAAGTVDAWLVYRLTGEHRIEIGNASRTLLLDIASGEWDPALAELFRIPEATLPVVTPSDARTSAISAVSGLEGVPITAVLADSHAALYAHDCPAGAVKVTYGTGSSVLGLVEDRDRIPADLVATIAWATPQPALALEGNILATGATLAWLSQLLGTDVGALSDLARTADRGGHVTLVPAFAGLGAPWWDKQAEALISGLTLGTTAADLAHAAFESVAMQIEDILALLDPSVDVVLADGGPSANDWLMQLQADVSRRSVRRPASSGLSALGAARLAALGCGVELPLRLDYTAFEPITELSESHAHRERWLRAIGRSRSSG